MPIQFCCTQCGQPIEVDDEHAGRTAACPFCRHLVTVPQHSTLDPRAAVPARPLPPGGGAMAGEAEIPAPATLQPVQRGGTARSFGTAGLIAAVAAVVLYLVIEAAARATGIVPSTQPTQEEAVRIGMQHPWLIVLSLAMMLLALLGLILGIVSLVQQRRGNWRGGTAVLLSGMFLFCSCAATLVQFAALG